MRTALGLRYRSSLAMRMLSAFVNSSPPAPSCAVESSADVGAANSPPQASAKKDARQTRCKTSNPDMISPLRSGPPGAFPRLAGCQSIAPAEHAVEIRQIAEAGFKRMIAKIFRKGDTVVLEKHLHVTR